MRQLEAKLWHSSNGDKIHSNYLYLETENAKHLATKFFIAIFYKFLVPFCIHAAKFKKTFVEVKNCINEMDILQNTNFGEISKFDKYDK